MHDAIWDQCVHRQDLPDPGGSTGIDAYFPAKVGDDASSRAIAAIWNDYLDLHAPGRQPGVLLSEVGIRDRRLAGIHFWKMDLQADPGKPTPIEQGNLDFTGYARSEEAIRGCSADLAQK